MAFGFVLFVVIYFTASFSGHPNLHHLSCQQSAIRLYARAAILCTATQHSAGHAPPFFKRCNLISNGTGCGMSDFERRRSHQSCRHFGHVPDTEDLPASWVSVHDIPVWWCCSCLHHPEGGKNLPIWHMTAPFPVLVLICWASKTMLPRNKSYCGFLLPLCIETAYRYAALN